ncbi:hypothetical protein FACS1894113_5090 [Alphaproteobacteria bacterium]|jgi:hypothetical protein|nr:hypothetical protein FACS1894113_5090 [Alphaproteobacteria bacterium]
MSCNIPPPSGWVCTEHFAGRVWEGELATDIETAKDNAVMACTRNWVSSNDCFNARNFDDAMTCRARD